MAGELAVVYRTSSREEMMVVKSLLEAHGIECLVQQESIGKIYAIASDGLGDSRLMVPEEEAERAVRIIEDTKKEGTPL